MFKDTLLMLILGSATLVWIVSSLIYLYEKFMLF